MIEVLECAALWSAVLFGIAWFTGGARSVLKGHSDNALECLNN